MQLNDGSWWRSYSTPWRQLSVSSLRKLRYGRSTYFQIETEAFAQCLASGQNLDFLCHDWLGDDGCGDRRHGGSTARSQAPAEAQIVSRAVFPGRTGPDLAMTTTRRVVSGQILNSRTATNGSHEFRRITMRSWSSYYWNFVEKCGDQAPCNRQFRTEAAPKVVQTASAPRTL